MAAFNFLYVNTPFFSYINGNKDHRNYGVFCLKNKYMRTILLLLLSVISLQCFSQSNEEAAIKLLLEKESATWRSGDVKAHAECWHIQPYSRILVSIGDSTVIDVPPAQMLNPSSNSFGKGGFATNSNYKINITGNTAWVSHDEESTAAEGNKTYSAEFRMLEKINGQWKLVAQSIHLYKVKR